MDKKEEPKKIKVVSGNGKDLDISPVYDHLNVNRSQQKPKNIVVPKPSQEINKEKNSSDDTNTEDDK